MMKFSLQPEGPVGVVGTEQAGDDVIVRINGQAAVVFQSQGQNGPELAVASNVLNELGITLRVDP